MSASSHSSPGPSFLRVAIALLVTLLALGGALIGALLLATGALLTFGLRALGIGGRRPPAHRPQPAPAPGILEGEYRVIDSQTPTRDL